MVMHEARSTSVLILEAARRTIRARGPEKLSMSAVAAEAGVSRSTLYRWFPTKAMLLGAITAYEVEQFDDGLQELADQHCDPGRRLDAALRSLVTYLDETLGAGSIYVDADSAREVRPRPPGSYGGPSAQGARSGGRRRDGE